MPSSHRRKFDPRLRARWNAAADVAALVAASVLGGAATPGWRGAALAFVVAGTTWAFASRALRHYDLERPQGAAGEALLTLVQVAAVAISLGLASWLADGSAWAPSALGFVAWLAPPVVAARQILVRARIAARRLEQHRVLIVGAGPLGRATAIDLRDARSPRTVVGHLALCGEEPRRLLFPLLGVVDQLDHILEEHAVSEVYVALDATRYAAEMQRVIGTCEKFGIPFAIPSTPFRYQRARARDAALGDGFVHFVTVRPRPVQWAIKRLIDVVASGTALLLLAPVLFGVALAVKLTSPGPVLFRQRRVGLYGRPFDMLKFRSMVVDAEALREKLLAVNEQTGPVFKMARDPRVTRVGRFIRKFSIDELPQLVNVLRGEMSIVGPRPPIPSEVAKYEPWQRRRLSVRPGLTCVWQVSGRNQISFEQWMYLDMQYIDNWTLAHDLGLILRTVPVVITGQGAS
jgi:exopolysaccharide biosynthesis polyprenyl glycosylphosphotransferase